MAIVGLGAAANGVGTPGSGFVVSYTQVAGSNRLASLAAAWQGTVDITAIDFGGVAMQLVAETTQGAITVQMWAVLEANLPADGTFDITISGSSSGNTASVTCGMHSGVMQQALPPPSVGGDTTPSVNHDISVETYDAGDFVFWCMAKLGSVPYTDNEVPPATAALHIATNQPTGLNQSTNRSQNAVGTGGAVVARCVDDDTAAEYAGVAIVMREAFNSGPNPTVQSSGGPQTSTGTTNTLATTLTAGDNRLALLFVQTTGNERISSVTYGGVTAALITDGTTDAESITDSGADDLVVSGFVVKEASLPANGANNWVVTLTGAQPCVTQHVIVEDGEQGDLAGVTIAASSTGVSPLIGSGVRVQFPGSLAFATLGSVS